MRSALRPLCVLAALSLAGCHHMTLRTHLPKAGDAHETTFHYFVFGIFGDHELDLDAICPRGVAGVRTEAIAWLDVITLGIYTPRKVVVECAGVKK